MNIQGQIIVSPSLVATGTYHGGRRNSQEDTQVVLELYHYDNDDNPTGKSLATFEYNGLNDRIELFTSQIQTQQVVLVLDTSTAVNSAVTVAAWAFTAFFAVAGSLVLVLLVKKLTDLGRRGL